MGHIVLDLTSLTYQPTTKSSDRPGNPRRHVTFAMSELAQPDHAGVSDEEDDQPLVRPSTRREPREEKRDQATDDTLHPRFLQDLLKLHHYEGKKDRQYGKTQPPHWNKK